MPALELSESTRRWLTEPRPRWRGVLHRYAAIGSVPAGVWLVLQGTTGHERLALTFYAVAISFMLAVSAIVHLRRWPPGVTEFLLRLDHSAIYLAIAGAATSVALLGLDDWQRTALLVWSWGFCAAGLVVEWLPFAPPRGFSNTMYFTMSWATVLLLPWLYRNTGWVTIALLACGGLLYTAGGIVVALRRPDPDPALFGYHEIWHAMVVGALACHYPMMWTLVS